MLQTVCAACAVQSLRVPQPGLPKIPELLRSLLFKSPVLTFGSHVSNIDFVKVLEIDFIFFYIIFGQCSGH